MLGSLHSGPDLQQTVSSLRQVVGEAKGSSLRQFRGEAEQVEEDLQQLEALFDEDDF
eukprot:m.281105 g.281105  ORF g.281105 m.281105 type:complete len:57 (+) comp54923_c0_seq11:1659-1829(+)